jgi:hypothetical protein
MHWEKTSNNKAWHILKFTEEMNFQCPPVMASYYSLVAKQNVFQLASKSDDFHRLIQHRYKWQFPNKKVHLVSLLPNHDLKDQGTTKSLSVAIWDNLTLEINQVSICHYLK